jgi:hypothetical protein
MVTPQQQAQLREKPRSLMINAQFSHTDGFYITIAVKDGKCIVVFEHPGAIINPG